jgi:hypothetical protein
MFRFFPRSHPTSRTRPPRQPASLRLEELESRTLLSVFAPDQVRHAYGIDQLSFVTAAGHRIAADGSGQTIAIVDAHHDPNIVSDLHYFDWMFDLPNPPRFTVATPQGTPSVSSGWALETALDVEWAHAIAPGANILLVEARSSNWSDLFGAIDYARSQPGVSVVSMSFGSAEWSGEGWYDYHFTTPAGHRGGANLPGGITFVASSGDYGAGSLWPALSPNVLAVGATALRADDWGTYQGETAWGWSGGGYSSYEGEPRYQRLVQNSGRRTTPDVAFNGDPWTGFYVYDTVPYGWTGWFQLGGTSAGAPQWSGLIALVDQGRALAGKGSLDGPSQTLPAIYQLSSGDFHDITSGSNGYAAGRGYDLVTGRGSPRANLLIPDLLRLTLGTGHASSHPGGNISTSHLTTPQEHPHGAGALALAETVAMRGAPAAPADGASAPIPTNGPAWKSPEFDKPTFAQSPAGTTRPSDFPAVGDLVLPTEQGRAGNRYESTEEVPVPPPPVELPNSPRTVGNRLESELETSLPGAEETDLEHVDEPVPLLDANTAGTRMPRTPASLGESHPVELWMATVGAALLVYEGGVFQDARDSGSTCSDDRPGRRASPP